MTLSSMNRNIQMVVDLIKDKDGTNHYKACDYTHAKTQPHITS